MGDEREHDWEAYKASLGVGSPEPNRPLAAVTYLHACTHCKGIGHHAKDEPCVCVQDFKCPRCGFRHPKKGMIGWVTPNRLMHCYKCKWTNQIGEYICEN